MKLDETCHIVIWFFIIYIHGDVLYSTHLLKMKQQDHERNFSFDVSLRGIFGWSCEMI